MDFIKSFLLVKGEDAVTDDKLAWLSSAHLPYLTDVNTGTLLVFNIYKYHLQLFVRYFKPSEWWWNTVDGNLIPDDYADMFFTAERIIAENTFTYHSYAYKDANGDPFAAPAVYQLIAEKAFKGTGYSCWKQRYFLCMGLNDVDKPKELSYNATGIYTAILNEAAEASDTPVNNLTVHIYFDRHTFYVWTFPCSDTRMSVAGGSRELTTLYKDFSARIKDYGFERNVNSRCCIDGYLDKLGLELPICEEECYIKPTYNTIHDYVMISSNSPKQDKAILRNALAYGVDELLKQYLIVNAENDVVRLIDECGNSIAYSRNIPDIDDEYGYFFANVHEQILSNTAISYYQGLPNCRYKTVAKYAHLKGLDARATEKREVVIDDPHRVIKIKIGNDEPFRLIEQYIRKSIGEDLLTDYIPNLSIQCEDGSPIIKYFAYGWRPRSGEYDPVKDAEIFKCFEKMGFERYPSGALATRNTIVEFFEKLLCNMPDLREYFRII